MTNKQWFKWYPNEWEQETSTLSHTHRGHWSIIKGRIYQSKTPGECSYSTTEWAYILRTTALEIQNIFDKLATTLPIKITKKRIHNSSLPTITIKYIPLSEKLTKIKQKYIANTRNKIPSIPPDTERLKKIFEHIKSIYHPSRLNNQPIRAWNTFKENFTIINKKTIDKLSNDTKGMNVSNELIKKTILKAEKKEINKIKNYIMHLKHTPEWDENNGKYLLGFGNFLKNEGWKTFDTKMPNVDPQLKIEALTELEKILDQ